MVFAVPLELPSQNASTQSAASTISRFQVMAALRNAQAGASRPTFGRSTCRSKPFNRAMSSAQESGPLAPPLMSSSPCWRVRRIKCRALSSAGKPRLPTIAIFMPSPPSRRCICGSRTSRSAHVSRRARPAGGCRRTASPRGASCRWRTSLGAAPAIAVQSLVVGDASLMPFIQASLATPCGGWVALINGRQDAVQSKGQIGERQTDAHTFASSADMNSACIPGDHRRRPYSRSQR